MSIILDALKKLDRERAGRRHGPPDIDTEILRPGPPVPRKKTALYFATIVLTAVAATAITYAVVVWLGFPAKSGPPASMTSSAPKQQVSLAPPEASSPPKPLPPVSGTTSAPKQSGEPTSSRASGLSMPPPSAPATPSATKQPVGSSPPEVTSSSKPDAPESVHSSASSRPVIPDPPTQEPVRASGAETGQGPSTIQSAPENKAPATPAVENKEGQNVLPEKADTAPGNKGRGAGPIPSGSAATLLSFRITAIGWDEDPSKRFAFVNGMMVHEGDMIEEAKIVEIYPKRIRFLHNGQYLEIRM